MKKPIKIALTGSAGNIGYALAFRIASGEAFGAGQPVELRLIDIKSSEKAITGMMMELEDCAFTDLHEMHCSFDPTEGFQDVDYALLAGARPRVQGMQRKDLLRVNSEIFRLQGQALNESASRDVRVVVVGNPANTNTLVAIKAAQDLPPTSFSCLLRLDHNRAASALAQHLGCPVGTIRRLTVWGNHSATQFPDLQHCTAGGRPVIQLVDDNWRREVFVPHVQQRGAQVIMARGKSSAASAANAIIDHLKVLYEGTHKDDWTSMGVLSDGSYGISPDIIFSYPVTIKSRSYKIISDLKLDAYSQKMLKVTEKELLGERAMVLALLR